MLTFDFSVVDKMVKYYPASDFRTALHVSLDIRLNGQESKDTDL